MNTIRTSCIFVFALISSVSTAQRGQLNYAVGLRLGTGLGASIQHFITNEQVVEGIVSSRSRGFTVTGLYELHTRILDAKGFRWYFGVGAHGGSYSDYGFEMIGVTGGRGTHFFAGGDGILGAEYFMKDLPVQFSADWKPEYNFAGLTGWKSGNLGISVRYRFQ